MLSVAISWLRSKSSEVNNDQKCRDILDELHKPDPDELVDEESLEKKRISDAINDFNCFSQIGRSIFIEVGNI